MSEAVASSSHAVVAQEEFDALWDEFQAFKEASSDLEAKLHEQLDERDREIRNLTRQLSNAFQQRDEYRERSNGRTYAEDELRAQIDQQGTEITRLRDLKRRLEDDLEKLESAQRGEVFQVARLQDERDQALDRAIVAETRVDEVEEECSRLRGDLAALRRDLDALREASSDPHSSGVSPSLALRGDEHRSRTADDAAALADMTRRIETFASACLQMRQQLQQSNISHAHRETSAHAALCESPRKTIVHELKDEW